MTVEKTNQSEHSTFSIKNQYDGVSVLLTGATGYVGSLVLEQLLRCCPNVKRIYVLARGKKGISATFRLRKILHSGLFNLVRDKQHLLDKVVLLEGDLLAPGENLGIAARHSNSQQYSFEDDASDTSEEFSSSKVSGHASDVELGISSAMQAVPAPKGYWDPSGLINHIGCMEHLMKEDNLLVIHCAARIALEDPLPVTLKFNYMGAMNLLRMVKHLPGVQGIVHVSTTFVNSHAPFRPVGTAMEQIYPLCFGARQIDHADVVKRTLAMNMERGDAYGHYLCNMWGFPNSYTLGKHLTEQVMADAHCDALPVTIVRPSFVGALAGKPYPGYVGNLAGPSGFAVAFQLGFFAKHAVAMTPYNHLDMIPGDMASSLVIAAGAALLARYDTATRTWQRRRVTGSLAKHVDMATPTASHLSLSQRTASSSATSPASVGANDSHDVFNASPLSMCNAASHNSPLHDITAIDGQHHDSMQVNSHPGLFKDAATASTPARTHATAPSRHDGGSSGGSSSSGGTCPPLAIFHSASSTMNPASNLEAYILAKQFFGKHDFKWRIGKNLNLNYDYKPGAPWKQRLAHAWLKAKVHAAGKLLACFGYKKPANMLTKGHMQWAQSQDPKNNFAIFFDVTNTSALESLLPADEAQDFPLTWRQDWQAYGNTYMAAVLKLFMGQPVPQSDDHSFVYIPSRRVATN